VADRATAGVPRRTPTVRRELIGAKLRHQDGGDRNLFGAAMARIGLANAAGFFARRRPTRSRACARRMGSRCHPPVLHARRRAARSYHPEELEAAVKWGLQQGPVQQVLVEESFLGFGQ
jgi:carbamoylphosphate synthase large subunit